AATHRVDVTDQIDVAVRSLAAHQQYLSVLDPDTSVVEQARRQIEMVTGDGFCGFELKRSHS
ncbi:MAG: PIG-L family deacetylase, partial [Actinomycetota bacterium]|nr:PIG-L family deacetylase [Actinomycetota bacterium]